MHNCRASQPRPTVCACAGTAAPPSLAPQPSPLSVVGSRLPVHCQLLLWAVIGAEEASLFLLDWLLRSKRGWRSARVSEAGPCLVEAAVSTEMRPSATDPKCARTAESSHLRTAATLHPGLKLKALVAPSAVAPFRASPHLHAEAAAQASPACRLVVANPRLQTSPLHRHVLCHGRHRTREPARRAGSQGAAHRGAAGRGGGGAARAPPQRARAAAQARFVGRRGLRPCQVPECSTCCIS